MSQSALGSVPHSAPLGCLRDEGFSALILEVNVSTRAKPCKLCCQYSVITAWKPSGNGTKLPLKPVRQGQWLGAGSIHNPEPQHSIHLPNTTGVKLCLTLENPQTHKQREIRHSLTPLHSEERGEELRGWEVTSLWEGAC